MKPAPDSLSAISAETIRALFIFIARPIGAAAAAKATVSGSAGSDASGADSAAMLAALSMGARGGCGRPMYQGLSSGRAWLWPWRVVDSTSATSGQSSPLDWVISAR